MNNYPIHHQHQAPQTIFTAVANPNHGFYHQTIPATHLTYAQNLTKPNPIVDEIKAEYNFAVSQINYYNKNILSFAPNFRAQEILAPLSQSLTDITNKINNNYNNPNETPDETVFYKFEADLMLANLAALQLGVVDNLENMNIRVEPEFKTSLQSFFKTTYTRCMTRENKLLIRLTKTNNDIEWLMVKYNIDILEALHKHIPSNHILPEHHLTEHHLHNVNTSTSTSISASNPIDNIDNQAIQTVNKGTKRKRAESSNNPTNKSNSVPVSTKLNKIFTPSYEGKEDMIKRLKYGRSYTFENIKAALMTFFTKDIDGESIENTAKAMFEMCPEILKNWKTELIAYLDKLEINKLNSIPNIKSYKTDHTAAETLVQTFKINCANKNIKAAFIKWVEKQFPEKMQTIQL